MKVALIHIRLTRKGGLETRLYNYIDYFLKRGDEIEVITSKIDSRISLNPSVKIHKIDLSAWPRFIRPVLFDKAVTKILGRTSFDFSLGLERTSSPLFLIAPNTHAGYLEAKGKKRKGISDLVQLHMDKISFSSVEKIFACSSMVKEEIIRFYSIPPDKIQTLYPPLDSSKFNIGSIPKFELRKKLGLPENKKLFLLVSTSHKRKGLQMLSAIFSHLQDDCLLIVAGSDCSAKENVRCLGYIENMEDYYKAVDFTLLPAVYEPFGQTVSESIACGTPAFVSGRVGAKEIITRETGKIIDSLEFGEWFDAIKNSRVSDYQIDQDLVNELKLSIEDHMEKMLNNLKQQQNRF